ncbi:MAG: tRNA 2-selenouridine(34) synthase MnmH [Bacteroidia bacterium]|nr:tRNA 2-selenouridine(34) synthase MnmH [Bacteroidia bacterium]
MELEVNDFLRSAGSWCILDVRSPGEFSRGHIPGAVNLPLLDDRERAMVGTVYKKEGPAKAIHLGKRLVEPKIPELMTFASGHFRDNNVLLHCWRGGMRSGNVAAYLRKQGVEAYTLKRGYKAYRQYVRSTFSAAPPLLVLGGETGSGKTEILKYLKEAGEQVIDLETLAHHKGSSFGALGELPQPTSEQFENNLQIQWSALDHNRRFWLEDESHTIGKVCLPGAVWERMKAAPIIRVTVPREDRVQRLLLDYGNFPKEEIAAAIRRITRRLGPQHAKQALEQVEAGNAAEVARIALTYYDKAYDFNHQKRAYKDVHFVKCSGADAKSNALRVLQYINEKKW